MKSGCISDYSWNETHALCSHHEEAGEDRSWCWLASAVVLVAPPLSSNLRSMVLAASEEGGVEAGALPAEQGWTASSACAWIRFAFPSTAPWASCELTENKKLPAESVSSGFFPDISPVSLVEL